MGELCVKRSIYKYRGVILDSRPLNLTWIKIGQKKLFFLDAHDDNDTLCCVCSRLIYADKNLLRYYCGDVKNTHDEHESPLVLLLLHLFIHTFIFSSVTQKGDTVFFIELNKHPALNYVRV